MSEPIIWAEGISRTFNAGRPHEVRPVQELSLSVAAGECVALVGPSGSGKTTLLSLLACLDKPTTGRYVCRGEEVSRWSEKFLTRFRQRHIGVVFQQFNLVADFTAAFNIALPLWPLGWPARRVADAVARAAAAAQITHRLDFAAGQLSGGEMQRVAIARALVADPALLFADEPTANLDRALADRTLGLWAELKAAGKTIVLTTHDPLVIGHPLIDRVLRMEDGRLVN